jgi:hypothetical protein
LILSFVFEYHEILLLKPQGLHDWRVADCASFAMTYYEGGMNFFEPRVYNDIADNSYAVGECPILYYAIACLYKIFGPHEIIFRIVVLLLFFTGLINLYKIVKRVAGDAYYSLIIPLFLFSSPLIMVFANNFLGDIPSLSFALIGWNYIIKYKDESRLKDFWISMIFFTLAGLLKLNSAISIIAIGAMFFMEFSGWTMLNGNSKMFRHKLQNILGFAFSGILLLAWYRWAIGYNEKHSASFLGTQAWPGWPIWEVSEINFLKSFRAYFNHLFHIYPYSTIILLFSLVAYIILNRKHLPAFYFGNFVLMSMGIVLFFCVFFVGIAENIYYLINLMILPVFILLLSILILKNKSPHIFNSAGLKFILFGLLIMNVYYAKMKLNDYYHEGPWHWRMNENFYKDEFAQFLKKTGIKEDDKVISLPDPTPDVTLYLMRRHGWSGYNLAVIDSARINDCIRKGAKYLVLNKPEMIFDPELSRFSDKYIANYNDIYIYRLTGNSTRSTPVVVVKKKLVINDTMYLRSNPFGKLIAEKGRENSLELKIVEITPDQFAIQTPDGKFLSCRNDAGGEITTDVPWLKEWEKFQLIKIAENKIALKGVNGKFLSLTNEENKIKATADNIGPNETILLKSD